MCIERMMHKRKFSVATVCSSPAHAYTNELPGFMNGICTLCSKLTTTSSLNSCSSYHYQVVTARRANSW
ncbi:hypothetical protein FKM82_009373 [Ascaphus truei]